jgi:putative alpha-1,2-mannosidase
VTPLLVETGGLATLGNAWTISNEQASPGKYSCAIDEQRISAEITVTPRGSIHRYTFPKSEQAVIAVDFSHGGIVVDDGRTIPLRAEMYLSGHTAAEACVTMEGLPIRMAVSISGLGNKSHSSLWENGELCEGHFKTYESIRESTFYPFGVLFTAPTEEGQVVEIELAFSFRSREQARKNLATGTSDFQIAQASAEASWKDKLGRIQISGGDHNDRCIFVSQPYQAIRSS